MYVLFALTVVIVLALAALAFAVLWRREPLGEAVAEGRNRADDDPAET